jgi:NodT family efflux transporter outer membrane factor (OMF) lipoprotein
MLRQRRTRQPMKSLLAMPDRKLPQIVLASLFGSVLAVGLSACAAGPDFRSPPAPQTSGYGRDPPPAQTASVDVAGGEAQRFQFGRDLPGQWWSLFGSSKLDALVQAALSKYPDIDAQQAALAAAREDLRVGKGVFPPHVQGQAAATREKLGGSAVGPASPAFITSIYQANVSVAYSFDVFGGERRMVEGLQAQTELQTDQLQASYLTLSSNVAATAIQLAAIHDQMAATEEIIAIEEKQLALIQRQFELGGRTRADVLQQQSSLALVRATLPGLQTQLLAAEHELAVLTGQFPHDAPSVPFELADFRLPQDLPVSLPSSLVAQRPDIKAQAALMHQASAAVGVAAANLLPQLTLTGSFGDQSLDLAKLIEPGSNVWSLAGGVTQPLFEGGALRARQRAAVDRFNEASARYRLTVLVAFQNVADVLAALDGDARTFKADSDALDAAKAGLDLVQRQYDSGAVGYVSLFAAQQAFQQARIAYVHALASRYTDTVSLFQALGGGWWNRTEPPVVRAAAADQVSSKSQ